MKRRIVASLLATTMALSLGICGNSTSIVKASESEELFTRDENGIPDLQGETITIWIPFDSDFTDIADNYDQWEIVQKIEELMNVNLEFIHPAVGQEAEGFALMMAGDKLPDIIMKSGVDDYYQGGVEAAYADGVLYDYTDLINETNTPNFIEKVLNNDYLSKSAYDDEGRIIRLGACVSGSVESCSTMFGLMIRKDYLEATGLDVPVTIDDWTEMLTAMKENGVKYPLVFDNDKDYWEKRNAFSSAYGVAANTYYVEDGTVKYGPYEEAYEDYLKQLNEWYEAGLICPDFQSQSLSDSWSLMANDEAGAIANHLWDYTSKYYISVEAEDESKALVAADLPVLNEGDETHLMVTNRNLALYKYITADATNPEACVYFLDAMYTDVIEDLLENGIEGKGYTVNEDGAKIITTLSSDLSDDVRLGARIYDMSTASDYDIDYIKKYKYCNGVQPDVIDLMTDDGYDWIYPSGATLTTDESEDSAEYQSNITTYVEEMTMKFIIGTESFDNYENYRETLKSLGVETLIADYQAAYDRYEARE
jgi:putative aldouronate transport system substrate-binding protein